jgi:hypothetical protein
MNAENVKLFTKSDRRNAPDQLQAAGPVNVVGRITRRSAHVATTSEFVKERPRHGRGLSEIHKAEVMHVLPRHAAYVLGLHAPKILDEPVRRAIVALVNLRAREERGLVAVRLVLEEILSDELLDETLESRRIDELALQSIDLGAHQTQGRIRIDGRDVHARGRHGALHEWRVHFV